MRARARADGGTLANARALRIKSIHEKQLKDCAKRLFKNLKMGLPSSSPKLPPPK